MAQILSRNFPIFPSGNSALVPFQSFSRLLRHEISTLVTLTLAAAEQWTPPGIGGRFPAEDCLELNQLRGMKDVNYQVTTMMP